MDNYYNLFVKLSKEQCLDKDYSDIKKVKKHNMATKKINQLQNKIKDKKFDYSLTLSKLLMDEDVRVRLNAASSCLQLNIHIEKSIEVLKEIMDLSEYKILGFNAKTILFMYMKE